MKTLIKTSIAILGLTTASASFGALVIDDFTDFVGPLTVTSGSTNDSANTSPVGPLNATRDLTIDYISGPDSSGAQVIDFGPGYYTWRNNTFDQSTASLSYSFSSTDVSLLTALKASNVTADINFNFGIRYEDANGGFAEIVLRSQGANDETRIFEFAPWLGLVGCPQGPFEPPVGNVVSYDCSGTLDLTQLTGLEITFTSVGNAADIGFSQLEFVPVPGTLFLIGGGLLGLGLMRRRANKAAA